MADVTVKNLGDFKKTFGGAMTLVRAGLGVSSFGIQLEEMPPNADRYPEHDHTHDGQEEVYTVLTGEATLIVGGEEYTLKPGTFARVGPEEKRKIETGEQGARLLVIGATPGKPYEVPEFSKEETPDPLAGTPA